jgi:para-aminobenzoate synthetase/4-amino-4-deoxychorismate lyase
LRAELLANGKVREQVLTTDDLANADAVYLGNSVRGLVAAEWIDTPRG